MALPSKRKRKRPMPDWIGVAYNPKATKELTEKGGKTSIDSHQSTSKVSVCDEKSETTTDTKKQIPEENPHHTHSRRLKASASDSQAKAPLSAEELIRLSLPLLSFGGSLLYCHHASDCSMLCEEILSCLATVGSLHVGFDMEWPVTYTAMSSKTALIQVCTSQDKCYLFHVAIMGCLPKSLKALLSHTGLIKYGINIEGDFWKLARDFDVDARSIIRNSVVDLAKMANEKLKSTERWTLDGLTRNTFRKRLDKDDSVRCGKWDQYPLSEEQLQYAANDAYASWLLADHFLKK